MMYIELQSGKKYVWKYREFGRKLLNIGIALFLISLYLLVAYIEYEL